MKRSFFLFLGMLLLAQPLLAQLREKPVLNIENKDKKFLNYGYYLGINQYDFKFDYENNTQDIFTKDISDYLPFCLWQKKECSTTN